MSAYLCENYHISFLAKYAIDHDSTYGMESMIGVGVEELAQKLYDANVRSIQSRYGDADDMIEEFKFDSRVEFGQLSGIQVIKAAQCYNYQTCEYDGYTGSDIERIIFHIISTAAHDVYGYDEAEWGCPEPQIVRTMYKGR